MSHLVLRAGVVLICWTINDVVVEQDTANMGLDNEKEGRAYKELA
jgi:hypothetical protein